MRLLPRRVKGERGEGMAGSAERESIPFTSFKINTCLSKGQSLRFLRNGKNGLQENVPRV